MRMRHPLRVSGSALVALSAFMLARGSALADLAAASPFLPANVSAAGSSAGPSGPIELRGVMSTPTGGLVYCIYDTAKKKDVWVGLKETGNEFVVVSADAASDSASVQYQGRTLKLTLRASKVGSAGAAAPPPMVAPGGPQVALNPTPADEQRRLDAVAQEVRRRKQEREKAVMDSQNGVAPPMVPNR
jgi:hypothetical protein